ncbi:hypothetical protein [Nonomuraea sp. NPDC003201]
MAAATGIAVGVFVRVVAGLTGAALGLKPVAALGLKPAAATRP